ncbi:hypothetical protein A9264_08390 [Vibrio sp. UCD-FRSSP16_10]|uniref:TadE/TadG family type IV pilus assembly protein n=1 Tax=unclassified Vibrio TaxID=2614977 RepID=UPI0008021B9D|nr:MULTISPECIES: TadE/TadG family type IV pilus assembly protein [unclassified Vibrio]OBT06582.1 hypothetical protein A9260_09175 [Vibrio sp. UCD-FRSSP16_30]OBT12279.1 hypothetical protein A9264_08390 [Vibrio sp. UCD-FRSSP16_10]
MINFKRNRGLAALEMVFVLPILLLLLVAIVEMGRMFMHYTTLNKALQSGVRSAVVETYGTERLSGIASVDYIQSIVVCGSSICDTNTVLPGLTKADISIDDSSISNYVTVTANYDYVPIFSSLPIIGTSFDVTMTASTIMRTAP